MPRPGDWGDPLRGAGAHDREPVRQGLLPVVPHHPDHRARLHRDGNQLSITAYALRGRS